MFEEENRILQSIVVSLSVTVIIVVAPVTLLSIVVSTAVTVIIVVVHVVLNVVVISDVPKRYTFLKLLYSSRL